MQTASSGYKATLVAGLVALAACQGEVEEEALSEAPAAATELPPIEVADGDGLPALLPAGLV